MDSSKQARGNGNSAMEIDRISELPDSIQFEILNLLDLKEAARTAVLSKQWRFLWMNVPFAFKNLSKDMEEIAKFVAIVHAALAIRRGPALDSLLIGFIFNERFTSDVDSWLDFAAKNEVKDLTLFLERDYSDESFPQHKYTLPQIIFSHSSLKCLFLTNCRIASPETTPEWRCLMCLALGGVDLPQQTIGEIVSGCPNLELLILEACSGFSRLEMGSRKLSYLSIDHFRGQYSLEISAPYLPHLHIGVFSCTTRGRTIVRLENVSSLETASIAVAKPHWPDMSVEFIRYTTVELLQQLAHVKILHLSESCAKAVSIMATKGWQLPQLSVEELQMQSENHARGIYGILAMLESSPYLENLVIDGCDLSKREKEKEVSMIWGPITKDDVNCNLLHLKIVEIRDFYGSDIPGEPTLTLARILLKRAPVLEKMKILNILSSVETDLIKKKVLSYFNQSIS